MTNNMTVSERTAPMTHSWPHALDSELPRYYSPFDDVRVGKLLDEVVTTVKDDRANTKRVLSAEIASTARVQNQNDRLIAACERELRRRDLSDQRRDELLDCINRAAESTAYESANSREFQRQQLEHSHKQPWRVVLVVVMLAIGGIGSAALIGASA